MANSSVDLFMDWPDGCLVIWMVRCSKTLGGLGGWLVVRVESCLFGWLDGWMDGWMIGWVVKVTNVNSADLRV